MADRKPAVLVTAPLSGRSIERLETLFELRHHPRRVESDADLLETLDLPSADGLLLSQPFPITDGILARCPKLRVVSKTGVGYEKIDVAAASRRGIIVCNTPGVLAGAVADMTFAILLALARKVRQNEDHVRSGAWARGPGPIGEDIRGRTLGIVGMGEIGRVVARTARGFDMKVLYHNRNRTAADEALGEYSDRDRLLREADIVSLHCPLTPQTRLSMGEREFALMKPGGYLVNMARGGVVDTGALVSALRSGHLGGAALDVTDPEPLDPTHPLCAMDNVVITPHVASGTNGARQAMQDLAVGNLIEGVGGKVPAASVNPKPFTPRQINRD